jgi:hypothetical protein
MPKENGVPQRWPKVSRDDWCGAHNFDPGKLDSIAQI